jgi:predicted N-formylglutamate amidohydrolase
MKSVDLLPAAPERWRPAGRGPILLLCDHASNFIPQSFASLGLDRQALDSHIAWDSGTAGVTRKISDLLDCPAVLATASRLLIDCNRDPAEEDSIVHMGEQGSVPGNASLDDGARAARVAAYYTPYHESIEEARLAGGPNVKALVAIHSFVPVYHGQQRPWHVGLIHNRDHRLAESLALQLGAETGLVVGDNEPYSPMDRVYHTLARHAEAHGLAALMIEIRNDLIAGEAEQSAWAARLAPMLLAAVKGLEARKAA